LGVAEMTQKGGWGVGRGYYSREEGLTIFKLKSEAYYILYKYRCAVYELL
jgi:hypothetical protein